MVAARLSEAAVLIAEDAHDLDCIASHEIGDLEAVAPGKLPPKSAGSNAPAEERVFLQKQDGGLNILSNANRDVRIDAL